MRRNVILIHPSDNVAVAIEDIKEGDEIIGIAFKRIKASSDIPRCHKVAVEEIAKDKPIIKYGESIGIAGYDIKPGDWVHTHNIKSEES